MNSIDQLYRELSARGYAVATKAVPPSVLNDLSVLVDDLVAGGRPVLRNLLDCQQIREVAGRPGLCELADCALGTRAFPVRALLFDKWRDANWAVGWHQDLTIAVRKRIDVPGYTRWTEKAGIPHVQPPVGILHQMVSVRLHIDPSDTRNGPVQVVEGSNRVGRIPQARIPEHVRSGRVVTCTVERGGVLLLSPLTLHASKKSSEAAHRRVVQVEYAAAALAGGLQWYFAQEAL